MNRRGGLLAALGWSAALCSPLAAAQAPNLGEMKPLGQDRFQIGRIVVDKRAGSFTVPGRVHVVGKPLEYLATTPGGMKEYEALFELQATGSEFNLACILVGLERDKKEVPWRQYRMVPRLVGPRIAISIAWGEGDKRRKVPAAQALLNPEAGVKPETVEWVYVGAPTSDDQPQFAADATGTLIGFVHDSNSVIESVTAIGLGAYGSVRGHAMLPPVGTAIELIVEAVNSAK